MKKNLLSKVVLTAFVTTMAFGTFVSAYGESNNAAVESGAEVNVDDRAEISIISHDLSDYVFYKGAVTSVQNNDDSFTTILLGDNGLKANLTEDITVIDAADGSIKQVSDIKNNMEVMVMLGKNTPMTMSIPPMTNSVAAVVINTDDANVDFSVYNDELVNAENTLKIEIGDDTVVTDINGGEVDNEEIKDHTALVLYGISTRSIPAQTIPSAVIVVEEVEATVNNEAAADEETVETTEPESTTNVVDKTPLKLREAGEKAGYTVKWVSNDEPVMLIKEGKEITVTAGSNEIIVNGVKAQLSDKVYLDSYDRMIAPYDFSDVL